MKISMMCNFGLSGGQQCDENHIKKGFEKLGHEVFDNNIPDDVDLILLFKTNKYSREHVIEWKGRYPDIPVWFWTFDNMDRFPNSYPIAKECDLWLGEELGRKSRWEQEGIPFYYFPNHAVPPDIFKKINVPKEYDVVFTGTPYSQNYDPDKNELLKAINERFDLHVFGNSHQAWKAMGIKNTGEPAFDEKLSELYGKSKIVIAISNVQCEGYWSIRTSQSLMCGAFALVRFTPQMEKELKDNVVYFQTVQECTDKIDYYLKHDKEREEIAEKGWMYANSYLTTQQRLTELILLFENRQSL